MATVHTTCGMEPALKALRLLLGLHLLLLGLLTRVAWLLLGLRQRPLIALLLLLLFLLLLLLLMLLLLLGLLLLLLLGLLRRPQGAAWLLPHMLLRLLRPPAAGPRLPHLVIHACAAARRWEAVRCVGALAAAPQAPQVPQPGHAAARRVGGPVAHRRPTLAPADQRKCTPAC